MLQNWASPETKTKRTLYALHLICLNIYTPMGRRGRDRMEVGFITICAIRAYHHLSYEFEPRSLWGVLDTTLCDKVCQWLAVGRWFSLGTPVTSTNKT